MQPCCGPMSYPISGLLETTDPREGGCQMDWWALTPEGRQCVPLFLPSGNCYNAVSGVSHRLSLLENRAGR